MSDNVPCESVLLAAYQRVSETHKMLVDIRFRLLAFVPTATTFGVALIKEWRDANPKAAVAALGLATTLAIAIYEIRNTQIHDGAVNGLADLEGKLGVPRTATQGGMRGIHKSLLGGRRTNKRLQARKILLDKEMAKKPRNPPQEFPDHSMPEKTAAFCKGLGSIDMWRSGLFNVAVWRKRIFGIPIWHDLALGIIYGSSSATWATLLAHSTCLKSSLLLSYVCGVVTGLVVFWKVKGSIPPELRDILDPFPRKTTDKSIDEQGNVEGKLQSLR